MGTDMEEEPKAGEEGKPGDRADDKPAGHGARERMKEVSGKAMHKLEETGEKAREKFDEAGEKAREARDRANEKIKEAREKARHSLGETGEKAREKFDEASEKAREAGQRTREQLGRAGVKAKDSGRKMMGLLRDGTKSVVESHWFQSISMQTWAGLALAAIYPVFMLFEQLDYRWWVMLPLGATGLYLLGDQWYRSEDRKSIDSSVCFYAFLFLALMMVYRDAMLSEMMLDRMEAVKGIKEVFK